MSGPWFLVGILQLWFLDWMWFIWIPILNQERIQWISLSSSTESHESRLLSGPKQRTDMDWCLEDIRVLNTRFCHFVLTLLLYECTVTLLTIHRWQTLESKMIDLKTLLDLLLSKQNVLLSLWGVPMASFDSNSHITQPTPAKVALVVGLLSTRWFAEALRVGLCAGAVPGSACKMGTSPKDPPWYQQLLFAVFLMS